MEKGWLDMEQKVEKQLSAGDIGAIIQQLSKTKRLSNDVAELVRQDLEYGYTQDMVERYVNTGWNYERMKKFSEILGKTSDQEFISFIEDSQLSARQMDMLLQAHIRQVPLDEMKEVLEQGMTEYSTAKMLRELAKNYEKVRELNENLMPMEGEQPSSEIMGRIQELVSGVGDNKDFLQKVLLKLEQLDMIQKNGDEVKASLSMTIEKQETLINEQQDRLNQQAKELVQKNNSYENLQKEKEILESKYETVTKALEDVRKENTAMKERVESMGREKDATRSERRDVSNPPDYGYEEMSVCGMPYVQLDRMERKPANHLMAFANMLFFRGKGKNKLLRHLKNASLKPAQMQQVKIAIEKGIPEENVIDIINSGFDATEMEQAIEILLAEKKMYN